MSSVVTLGDMVDLALGTPEIGCVNYNALHTLLHGLIAKLQISNATIQLGQTATTARSPGAADDRASGSPSEEWGAWIGSHSSVAESTGDGGRKGSPEKKGSPEFGVETEIAGGRGTEAGKTIGGDKGGKDKGSGGVKDKGPGGGVGKGKESGKAAGGSGTKSGGGGRGGIGSLSGNDGVPLMVNSLPFHELIKRVERLEDSWKELNEIQTIDPFGGGSTDEKGVQLHDMWETLQFQKRLDANTEGVDRLMGLVDEILRRIQMLAESDAEQMALITGSHQKLENLAPKTDFDAVKQALNSIAGKVDNLKDKGDGAVTWDHLESALKGGIDALQGGKGYDQRDGNEDSVGSMEGGGGVGGASLTDSEESELVLGVKDGEEDEEGGVGRREGAGGKGASGKGGKGGKDRHKHDSGREGGKGQEGGGTKDGGTSSGGKAGLPGEVAGSKRDGGGVVTGSGAQLGESNLDDGTGSRRSSGAGKAGPSPDLQTVLGVLGKLDEKFKTVMSKMSAIEDNLTQKDAFKVSPESMKQMSDSALVIETTREQMRDFNDELARSYLDPLTHANEIIATLTWDSAVTCPSLRPSPSQGDEYRLSGRKSLALGALEKTMKVVDKTFGVLQRAVLNLDCKLTNQAIKLDDRLSRSPDGGSRPGSGSRNLLSSPSMEEEDVCKEEEPEPTNLDNQTRMKELEKKLGLRKDEMCKMTKRLNQLNRAISQQLHDAKDRLNDVESRLSDMTCDLKRLIQKIESDKGGEYVVPTAAVLDGSGVSLLIGVQKALDDLRTDMEKLSGKTDSLQQNNTRHQDSIENLLKLASDMEDKKTDKAEFIEKATKQDLDLKLDSRVFESTCDEMTKNVNSLLGRVSRLDEECKNSFDKLTSDLGGYMSSDEFDRIRTCMAKQFKVLAKKLAKMQKQLEIAKLVGDDAAGIRRQLFKCLSCDRPILMASQDPKPALPNRDGLFPYRSTKPYTTYELEQIRQHARCFQIPKGLSNYERAVIERQLSRFKIRDLRGNANPYWKQEHSSSNVKHIRTAAVSPNSQGDAAAAGTVAEDPFPDPYACTRPCGGTHTLTSPYKRVIHMADLNPVMLVEKNSSVIERNLAINADEAETELQTITSIQDKGQATLGPKTGTEHLAESQSNPQSPPHADAALSVIKQLSDDSGRRFSDPTITGGAVKKLELKKASAKGSPGDRRVSAPNTASSSRTTTPSAATSAKNRRYSTPVSMAAREASHQSPQLKKMMKDQGVKEEEVNKDVGDEEEKTKERHKDSDEEH